MFQNEALTDFTVAEFRATFRSALEAVNARVQAKKLSAAPIIDGKEVTGGREIPSVDPALSSVVVGTVKLATVADADRAVAVLRAGKVGWAATSFEKRCAIIHTLGRHMTEKRLELAALIVREAGKPWKEADADVAEAIDFCHYYADRMTEMGPRQKTQNLPGEDNYFYRIPKGISVVISPWNFPLAIACGMTVAALVTGNATILKPAEQTSLIAYEFAKLVLDAGVPPNAFAFLPGLGEDVGRRLVGHPHTDMICFTGSRAVGLEIIKTAGLVQDGQEGVKKVIAELSGKNPIIVDEDADLDEAIKGVLYSSFGYSGQKCSACSRVIIVGDAYEPFMTRIAAAAADLIVGSPLDSATLIGPVIDAESQARIQGIIDSAAKTTKVAFSGSVPRDGFYVPHTIFRDVESNSPIWRDEIFGPVVGCRQARDFDHAIELANDSSFALTAGLFTRSPANLQKAVEQVQAGNFYINRSCTGAMVARQPFGGFKMSGIGAQAGGPDYLFQFMHSRVVTENTMRRGFAPQS